MGGANGQDTKGIEVAAERERVTEVPFTHSLPVQSTATHEELVTTPASTSSSTMASWPTSTTPCTPNSTVNLHQGPMFPLPHPISIPHSFAKAISPRSAHFPPNRQHPQHSTSTVPFHSLSSAQERPSTASKRSLEAHTRGFKPSYVKPPTAPTPHLFEDRLDEILALLNSPIAAYCSFDSTSTHVDDVRGLGDLKNNAKIVGTNGHSNPMVTKKTLCRL